MAYTNIIKVHGRELKLFEEVEPLSLVDAGTFLRGHEYREHDPARGGIPPEIPYNDFQRDEIKRLMDGRKCGNGYVALVTKFFVRRYRVNDDEMGEMNITTFESDAVECKYRRNEAGNDKCAGCSMLKPRAVILEMELADAPQPCHKSAATSTGGTFFGFDLKDMSPDYMQPGY
jgi:hypothetical protein